MRRSLCLVALGIVLLSSCKRNPEEPADTFEDASVGHFSEVRDSERLVRVMGAWPVQGDGTTAARTFVETHRASLELLEGVELGNPVALDDDGDVVGVPLSFEGRPIFGGEVRLRIVGTGSDRRIVTVSVDQPAGFAGSDTLLSADEAAQAAGEGVEVAGSADLWWLSSGMLLGSPDDARTMWRVPVRGDEALAPSVRWVDAETGAVIWDDVRVAHFIEVRDADGNGGRLDVISEEESLTRAIYRDGNPVDDSADPEATAAKDFASLACQRMQSRFGEQLPCDDLTVIVDMTSNPGGVSDPDDAFASCNPDEQNQCTDSILVFGPTTMLWESGRQTFEHELWHAFVDRASPLVGAGEQAAVNESFADLNAIFATRPGDEWILGIGNPGEPEYQKARNASNPADTGHPTNVAQLTPAALNDPARAHANGVLLTHGVWQAVVNGGTVAGRNWSTIPYDQAEHLLYLATKYGLGATTTLKRAAENMAVECILAVIDANEGDLGSPPHGLQQAHCGAIVNGFAAVGLLEQDRDVDGLWDSIDPCPDLADVTQAWDFAGECETGNGLDAGTPVEEDMPETPAEPYVPPACDGPALDCPPAYDGDGVAMVLMENGTDPCFHPIGVTSDTPERGAECAYGPAYASDQDVARMTFSVNYIVDRSNHGRGCIVDSEGLPFEEPTRSFVSTEKRVWGNYRGPAQDEENEARRAFGSALVEQAEQFAWACETVDCPDVFVDEGVELPFSMRRGYGRVPTNEAYSDLRVSRADCIYGDNDFTFAMRWAQEDGEELVCPDVVNNGAKVDSAEMQAQVSFPSPVFPNRVEFATTLLQQILPRAKACP